MDEIQKSMTSFAIAKICFVMVIIGAALSIFGLMDAYLAADLLVFNTLSYLHATVIGAVISLIAVIGIGGILMTTGGSRHFATGQRSGHSGLGLDLRLTEPRLTGPDVEWIQAMLHVLQYPIVIDGEFGPETDQTVQQFQKNAKIGVNGVVGQETLGVIQREVEALDRTKWVDQIMSQEQRLAPSGIELLFGGSKVAG